MQKANGAAPKVGRPVLYDREAVVSAAMLVFWEKGFSATTLHDLEEATGVDRSTLYNSFDGKRGLFCSAAAAYVDLAEEQLFERLYGGTDGIADIVDLFDRIDAMFESDTPTGCLIVTDMGAVTDPATTRRYLEHLEGGLRAALERAAIAGQIDSNRCEQRCRLLIAAVIGLNQLNHSGSDTVVAPPQRCPCRGQVVGYQQMTNVPTKRSTETLPRPHAKN
ncbi:MAG: TetR/AcrR family transcriptional regulator [Actinobacteria bacterium]|nr:TetR/AcrR family transcriptional regulator [Actinomycetota bacterium]